MKKNGEWYSEWQWWCQVIVWIDESTASSSRLPWKEPQMSLFCLCVHILIFFFIKLVILLVILIPNRATLLCLSLTVGLEWYQAERPILNTLASNDTSTYTDTGSDVICCSDKCISLCSFKNTTLLTCNDNQSISFGRKDKKPYCWKIGLE